MLQKNRILIIFSLLGLSAISLVRFIDFTDSWIIDIFSHFPVQYAFLALILLGICVWKMRILPAVFFGLLLILNAGALGGSGEILYAADGKSENSFKVYSANINKSNKEFSALEQELQNTESDIMLLLEITQEHIEKLKSVFQTFSYRVVTPALDDSNLRAVLLSKVPVLDYQIEKISEGNVIITAMLGIKQNKILFYGAHFPRPTDPEGFFMNKRQILRLANKIKSEALPIILAGDFNTTPYSPIFRELLRISGLKDSRQGFGWQPSWPAFNPLLWIPIDHILVSHDINVHKRTVGSYIGSDHYPVFAELSLR